VGAAAAATAAAAAIAPACSGGDADADADADANADADADGEADGEADGGDGPCVLLTGATGALGPQLLAALLATTQPRPWATVAVLARGPIDRVVASPAEAAADAAAAAADADAAGKRGGGVGGGGASGRDSARRGRLRVFAADLARPDLGLSRADRAALRRLRVASVVHSAAAVDHARTYEELRPVNAASALALVELLAPTHAGGGGRDGGGGGGGSDRARPLIVFVSSLSVIPLASAAASARWAAGSAASLVPPACAAALETGYAQTKLVAEHHLAAAAAAGRIRLLVARLGLIGPPAAAAAAAPSAAAPSATATAAAPPFGSPLRDWLSLLLGAVEATGASPAGLTSGGRSVARLPVDVAAAALAEQAARYEDASPPPPPTTTMTHGAPLQPGRAARKDARAEVLHLDDVHGGGTQRVEVLHLDAAAFGIPPCPLSALLDQAEAARGAGAPPLRPPRPPRGGGGGRHSLLCYTSRSPGRAALGLGAGHALRRSQWWHVALPPVLATTAQFRASFRIQAGPPASLALAMLPPPGRGGELRFPSGAGRRIREIEKGMRGS
jgi:nucleoside-diphosphate-sugar epimerase